MGKTRGIFSRFGARCIVVLLVIPGGGCAAIDQFSTRTQDFNQQTANSKSNQILLNVVRSAYAQPLQFTDVSTIAGTAGVSGTLGETIPFPLNIAARTGARSISASPSVTANGGNTVNVANLYNQEFYQGLQKPLAKSQIAYYLFSGFYDLDPKALLPLFISEIEATDSYGRVFVLRNRGTSRQSFNRFFMATSQLIKGGLRTELGPKPKPTNVGPELSDNDVKDLKILPALVTSSTGPTFADANPGLTLATLDKSEKKEMKYQLQRAGGSRQDQFCFAYTNHPQDDLDLTVTAPIKTKQHVIHLGLENGKYVWPVVIPPAQYCGQSANSDLDKRKYTKISLKTRSVEEIFSFLGQIVRTELGLESGVEASLEWPFEDGRIFRLFHVERRLPIGEEPWAYYNGQVFTIRIDPSGGYDASSRVIQLVTDLLALQSSAKNLPAPNLIAITQ